MSGANFAELMSTQNLFRGSPSTGSSYGGHHELYTQTQ